MKTTAAQRAAEESGRARSGAYSTTKNTIADLTNDELREAAQWPRFTEDWKQALIQQERRRRGI